MTVTAKELRVKTSDVLKRVQRLGSVTITVRGRPVAKLTALTPRKPIPLAEHPSVGIWANRRDMKNVNAWLRKMRKPRRLP
jgi:prevent-host-death family protein